jgi:acyl carrier protein
VIVIVMRDETGGRGPEGIQDWLKQWFATRGKLGGQANQRLLDVDYFEAGWLTSMEVVEFVTEIEQQFGMQFSDRDLQDRRFVTISGLTELILESTQTRESR